MERQENLNTRSMQEDSILNEVVEIEIDRWCADPDEYLGAQKKELKSQVHFRD